MICFPLCLMKKMIRLFLFLIAPVFFSCNNSVKKKTGTDNVIDSFTSTLKENKVEGELYISLPETYSVRHKGGADFMVYYLGPADSTVVPSFSGGIYLGNFPSEFPATNDSCKTSSIKGKILDNAPEWKIFTCDSSFFLQTIIDNKGDKSADKLHAFGKGIVGNEEKVLKMFATLKRK